jgi:glycerate kinase
MIFLLTPDSFKGSLAAAEVAGAMEKGIKKVVPDAKIYKIPMADGGEGTVDTILQATDGEKIYLNVKDPLGRTINAFYGILPDKQTAIIEMAAASGLALLHKSEQNPLQTSTFGTGELIKDAIRKGCKNIIVCIGGSATNDGGTGMLQALGVKFYNLQDDLLEMKGENLSEISFIDITSLADFSDISFVVACDVNNPLLGEKGASCIFSPQKGATPEMAEQLERGMLHFANIAEQTLQVCCRDLPGAGAAGGLGFGLLAFLKAKLKKGVEMILEINAIEKVMQQMMAQPHSLVMTGEGKIDNQTAFGKVVFGVASLAKKYQLPVVVIAGGIGESIQELYETGINSIFSITNKPMSLSESMSQSRLLIENVTENIVRLWKLGFNISDTV